MNISGPQHRQMPYEMAEAYRELFRMVKKEFPAETLTYTFPVMGSYYNEHIQISRLTPFEGEDYPANDEEAMRYIEPAVRLMVIGEHKIKQTELTAKTAEEFSRSAGDFICYTNYIAHCSIDQNHVPEYPGQIIEKLKPTSALNNKWHEHILWYNPFVFESPENKSTNKQLQKHQLPLCQKLLTLHIDFFRPTHILFLDGCEKLTNSLPNDRLFIKKVMNAFQ